MRRRAFTFLELMFVVLIISVLSTIVASTFIGRALQSNIIATRATIAAAEVAIQQFELDYDRLPQSLLDLVEPPAHPLGMAPPFYLETPPRDAWGMNLVYGVPPEHFGRLYDIYSQGPNGVDDGGLGDDVIPGRFITSENP